MNLLSHVMLILALSEVLGLNLACAIIGAVIPDIDYLIGVAHRTIMHSLIFGAVILIFSFKRHKRAGISFFIGFLTHLLLDVLTTQGVQLLWPINTFFTFNLFNSMESNANLLVVILSFILLLNKDLISDKLSLISPDKVRVMTFFVLLVPIIASIPYTLVVNSSCQTAQLEGILGSAEDFDEKCVIVNGYVCSNISDYTSSAGNEYKIFSLCSGQYNLSVWAINAVYTDLSHADNVSVTGIFTTKYVKTSGYEIYMVKELRKD